MSSSKPRQDGLWLGVWLLSLLLVVVLSITVYVLGWIEGCPFNQPMQHIQCDTTLNEVMSQAIEYLRILLVIYAAVGWIPAVYSLVAKYWAQPRENIFAEKRRLYQFFLIVWLLAIPCTVAFSFVSHVIYDNNDCYVEAIEPLPCGAPDGPGTPRALAQATIAATPLIAAYAVVGWIPVLLLCPNYKPTADVRKA